MGLRLRGEWGTRGPHYIYIYIYFFKTFTKQCCFGFFFFLPLRSSRTTALLHRNKEGMNQSSFPTRGGAEPLLHACFPARGVATATPRPHLASPLSGRMQLSKRLSVLNSSSHAIMRPQSARYALNLRDLRSFRLDFLDSHHGAQSYRLAHLKFKNQTIDLPTKRL